MPDASNLPSKQQYYTTYPFALAEGSAGGLSSVFLKESGSGHNLPLHILSTDAQNMQIGSTLIHAAAPEERSLIDDKFKYWFDTGCWQYLHPDAHTSVAASPQALDAMYDDGLLQLLAEENKVAALSQVGTLEHLTRYIDRYAPSDLAHRYFNQRFHALLADVPACSVINWQDYFFEPCINTFAESFRAKGCFQTFHLHTTLPDSLHLSKWGKDLLTAMSKVDVVYLHTEEYKKRLELQLEMLGINIPKIKRFDLGIDRECIERSLSSINEGNYQDSEAYKLLHVKQKLIVDESFRTRFKVPHRFICLDRADPNKGVDVTLSAVKTFLEEESKQHSAEELLGKYRFFFVLDLFDSENSISSAPAENMKKRYGGLLSQQIKALNESFPGIVWVSSAVTGKSRELLPHIMYDCHGLTGGAQDGLNLGIQEVLYANRRLSRTAIIGSGAGIAIRLQETNIKPGCVEIITPGKSTELSNRIKQITRLSERNSSVYLENKKEIVSFLESRNDSVIV